MTNFGVIAVVISFWVSFGTKENQPATKEDPKLAGLLWFRLWKPSKIEGEKRIFRGAHDVIGEIPRLRLSKQAKIIRYGVILILFGVMIWIRIGRWKFRSEAELYLSCQKPCCIKFLRLFLEKRQTHHKNINRGKPKMLHGEQSTVVIPLLWIWIVLVGCEVKGEDRLFVWKLITSCHDGHQQHSVCIICICLHIIFLFIWG